MKRVEKVTENTKVAEMVALLKKRRVPIIHENADIKEVVDIMISFEHRRLLYVVDDEKNLPASSLWGFLRDMYFLQAMSPKSTQGF